MKKAKTIKINKEQFLKENEDAIFQLFKKNINKEHGKGFSFERTEDFFVATTEKGSRKKKILENTSLQKIICDRPLSEINAEAFVKEHLYPMVGNRKNGTRAYNGLVVTIWDATRNNPILRQSFSLKQLLALPGINYLKTRNAGIESYVVICEEFRRLGFNTKDYPFFNAEERAKEANSLDVLLKSLQKIV